MYCFLLSDEVSGCHETLLDSIHKSVVGRLLSWFDISLARLWLSCDAGTDMFWRLKLPALSQLRDVVLSRAIHEPYIEGDCHCWGRVGGIFASYKKVSDPQEVCEGITRESKQSREKILVWDRGDNDLAS